MPKRLGISLLLLYILFGRAFSAIDRYDLISDLRDNWLIFDSRINNYVPFLENSLQNKTSISFPLNVEKYKNYTLYILAPNGTAVFFNQQIIAYEGTGDGLYFNIDSLRKVYVPHNILVTLYNGNFEDSGHLVTAVIRRRDHELTNTVVLMDPVQILRRNPKSFSDFFTFGLIVLLIIYAFVLNTFNRKLRSFYDLGRAVSLNIREEMTFKGKIFDGSNVPILLAHSFLIAFIGLTLWMSLEDGKMAINSFGDALGYWVLMAAVVFVLFIFKFWLLVLMGTLFKLPFINRHYLEYIRMSKIFFAMVFLLLIIMYLGMNQNIANITPFITKIIVIFAILRVLLLYFKFIQSSSFNNLYLFSYLCGTEILPMVVGLKILLQ